jgi:hypothetical protein
MSDEMERRLRETGEQLLAPYDSDTRAARTRFIEAATPAPKRRRRPLAAALVLAVAVASAFGVGYALASGGEKTRVVHEKQALDAGPGFLPAEGWQMTSNLAATAATAANASLGIRIEANFGGADLADSPPEALLPLQLDDATRVDASTRRLHVRVAAWDIDVRIHFDRTSTTALVAAREELGRLVVPSCPNAQELQAGDTATATRYLLSWLPAHYAGDAGETAGATATAAAGADAARHGQAAYYCGTPVADRTVEVDVVLPKLAQVSASLSQLTYFVARTSAGWTVWARAR